MQNLSKNKLIEAYQINERISFLGTAISLDYYGHDLICICVLKGAFLFFSDLVKEIKVPHICDFIKVSSYQGTSSTSKISLTLEPTIDLKDKHILLVEDIVDTGQTILYLLDYLQQKQPASIKICSLLDKPDNRQVEVPLHYTGFSIPNHFVVGYGLDLDEKYRTLPYISIYNET